MTNWGKLILGAAKEICHEIPDMQRHIQGSCLNAEINSTVLTYMRDLYICEYMYASVKK